jgi:uroporphyrinogen decarboxylase
VGQINNREDVCMTHRERILATFDFEKTDHVPKDLGSTIWTTMDAIAYQNVLLSQGMNCEIDYKHLGFQAVEINEPLLELFDIDTRGRTTKGPTGWVDSISEEGLFTDEWGIQRDVKSGSAITIHPLASAECNLQTIESYPWPDGTDPARYAGFKQVFENWRSIGEYATVLNIFGGFTTMAYLLRRLDNWCIDMLLDIDLFESLLDRTLKFEMDSANSALGELGNLVDIVAIADDFAGQDGMLFSPAIFRKYIKPRMGKLIETIQSRSNAKILFHCCGSVLDIIDDLVDLGIDALNPMQTTARGMDPTSLCKRYYKQMVFWGGVDSQWLLPFGTSEDVSAEVNRLTEVFANTGGYVLGAVHNIQGDVPASNVKALFCGLGVDGTEVTS